MRIIGGKYRSRVLAGFDGDDVRPTSDRAKEALFNILSTRTYGARVLDLFSGSGSLGLEALSRGAEQVTFNDLSRDSVAIVKKNLATLKVELNENVRVYNYDYAVCLDVVKGPFDLIFIDPPYKLDCGIEALKKIAQKGLLSENGVAVFERDRAFEGEIDGLEKYDERKYGKAYLHYINNIEKKNDKGDIVYV